MSFQKVICLFFIINWFHVSQANLPSSFQFSSFCNVTLSDPEIISQIERISANPKIKAAIEQLSKVYRTGWKRRGIPDSIGETVLEHSKKVFQAALIYSTRDPKLNRNRMAIMAFFHDIAEYTIPDFTPHDNIDSSKKHELERAAIVELISDSDSNGKLILSLWEEYASRSTPEAKIVAQLDKLDAAIQAFEYEKLGFDVSEFYSHAESKLTDPILLKILRDLLKSPKETRAYDFYFERLYSDKN